MRVTHVITRLVVGGAQENTVASVLGLLAKPGVEVRLLSGPTTGPEGSLEPRLADHPGLLTLVPSLVRPIHPWKDLLAFRELISFFRQWPPDLVHTHSGKAGFLGRLAARRAGVRVILHHIHGPSFGPFQGRTANVLFTAAERIAAAATTHFVCSAQAMTRLYLAAGIGRPEMYTRLFSGFQVDPFLQATNDRALRQQLGLSQEAFIIGAVGRMAPLKGHADLLAATRDLLPSCPHARLLFVGDGPWRDRIQRHIHALGLTDKVVCSGLVSPNEVPRYVGIMDCLAHLSSREALSRALPQALAAGKPVIAYDFDGADEVCIDGDTGFLVRTGDIATVTARLATLAKDPGLRQRFGERGRRLVSDNFRVEHMVETLRALYRELLERAPGPPG